MNETIGAREVFLTGGPLMWPLLACGIVSLAVTLERLVCFRNCGRGSRELLGSVLDKVKRNQIKEAVNCCEASGLPVAAVLKAGILKSDRPRSQVKEAIEAAALYEVPGIERNLPLLSTIAHVAPLLGLLGTAAGMASFFRGVYMAQSAAFPLPAAEAARALWQALITTCAGLAVSAASLVSFNYLTVRLNSLILDLEKASVELLDLLDRVTM